MASGSGFRVRSLGLASLFSRVVFRVVGFGV